MKYKLLAARLHVATALLSHVMSGAVAAATHAPPRPVHLQARKPTPPPPPPPPPPSLHLFPLSCLLMYFGHWLRLIFHAQSSFIFRLNPLQRDVVSAWAAGRDVFVLSGTGTGKSICFQIPALLAPAPSVVIVVSPLISLMRDQCAHMQRR